MAQSGALRLGFGRGVGGPVAAPAEPSPSTARGGGQLAMHSPALRVASMAKRLATLGTPTAPLAIVSKRKALGEAADRRRGRRRGQLGGVVRGHVGVVREGRAHRAHWCDRAAHVRVLRSRSAEAACAGPATARGRPAMGSEKEATPLGRVRALEWQPARGDGLLPPSAHASGLSTTLGHFCEKARTQPAHLFR